MEPISSHAEHARKCLKVEYLDLRFSKISCYSPLGPYGFGFCKKSKEKLHACVPLKGARNRSHRKNPSTGNKNKQSKNYFPLYIPVWFCNKDPATEGGSGGEGVVLWMEHCHHEQEYLNTD